MIHFFTGRMFKLLFGYDIYRFLRLITAVIIYLTVQVFMLQETRGAVDAAEMLVSRLQSAESNLSAAQVLVIPLIGIHLFLEFVLGAEMLILQIFVQEIAVLAKNAVHQIHLETKEIAEGQRQSLKHTEDAVVAACMKVFNYLHTGVFLNFSMGFLKLRKKLQRSVSAVRNFGSPKVITWL